MLLWSHRSGVSRLTPAGGVLGVVRITCKRCAPTPWSGGLGRRPLTLLPPSRLAASCPAWRWQSRGRPVRTCCGDVSPALGPTIDARRPESSWGAPRAVCCREHRGRFFYFPRIFCTKKTLKRLTAASSYGSSCEADAPTLCADPRPSAGPRAACVPRGVGGSGCRAPSPYGTGGGVRGVAGLGRQGRRGPRPAGGWPCAAATPSLFQATSTAAT